MDFPTTLDPIDTAELLPAAGPTPFYGYRDRPVPRPDGSVDWVQIPLTLEDACYPQFEDKILKFSNHGPEAHVIYNHLEAWFRDVPSVLMLTDTLVDWGIPGQRNTSPDFSIFVNVCDPGANWSVFPVKLQGARVAFVIEFAVPSMRSNDLEVKRSDYHRAGVPCYVVVDQLRENGPQRVLAWDWAPAGYVQRPADEGGRVTLPGTGIAVGLRDNRLHGFNSKTGERHLEFAELYELHLKAEEARQAAALERPRLLEAAAKSSE